jgi:8-oxo-dGTP diphosphatase
MSPLYVASAVLTNADASVFIVKRPPHKSLPGFWEFPGGKIEEGETPQAALKRELKEELGLSVEEKDLIPFSFVSMPYDTFHLVMLVFTCHTWQGHIQLLENQGQYNWVSPEDMVHYTMPKANLIIADRLQHNSWEP